MRLSFLLLILMTAPPLTAQDPAHRIEIFKAKRELQLFQGDRLVKAWPVALGFNPVPAKERQGDGATPEGAYFICVKNPKSRFYLSLGVSYPGPEDARRGFKAGRITAAERDAILKACAAGKTPPWNTKLGGEIFIHGNGSKPDWTWGCVALDDPAMKELYDLVPAGTPVLIRP
jgi:murein L,D-transpeptidase YafK